MGTNSTLERTPEPRRFHLSPSWSYGLSAAVILFVGLIRARLLSFPLERDEGEYAYAGELILRGLAPYQFCYTMKWPGTAAVYALSEAIFGRSAAGVHWGLLLVNAGTIVLVFLLGKRLFGELGGVVAAATFALLSLEPAVLGFAGHATQFVVLPAVGGVLLLFKGRESQKPALFFWSGVLLGLAALMKQPGIFFVLFGMFCVVHWQWKQLTEWRKLLWQLGGLLLGATLPLAMTCVIFLRMGVLGKFWFWTVSYARTYGSEVPLSDARQLLGSSVWSVVSGAPLIWLMAAAGMVIAFFDAKNRTPMVFVGSFLAFSFAAVCPGLYFREHYFVLLLPAVALLCAGVVSAGTNFFLGSSATQEWAALPAVIFGLCFVFSVVQERDFFFMEDPLTLCRTLYATNPFAEALQISDFIKRHSAPGDRIAVLGSEPEIYFYSDRLSATGYIYMYPLMEEQPFASAMQKEMIAEIEAAHPRFLVFVDTRLSWLRREHSDLTIFRWAETQLLPRYRLAGIVDMLQDKTEYHWADATSYRPRSPYRVFVLDQMSGGAGAP